MDEISPQELYPVVQDLTDVEYGYECCCCDTSMITPFSAEDLAMPVTTPKPIPLPPQPIKPSKKSHRRGNSLFSLTSSTKSSTVSSHRRSFSSPSSVSEDSTTTFCTESEERVTMNSCRFEETFVLTRQVSSIHLCVCLFDVGALCVD